MKEENDILKRHVTSDFKKEVPSVDFTQLVMGKVEKSIELKGAVDSLVSKKAWAIALLVSVFIVLISFGLEVQQSDVDWFGGLGFELPDFKKFRTTVFLSSIIVSILGLMTAADIFYRWRKHVI
tara:strand:- start:446 stop:817 length:372 start_codon:yes stop_codon:yes gene_type:complete